jgi:hypothetical protein
MTNVLIIDALTNEVIEREATKAELAILEESAKNSESDKIAREEKEAARISALAKLAALGLTEAEIAAL